MNDPFIAGLRHMGLNMCDEAANRLEALAAERDRLARELADAISDAEIARGEADAAARELAEARGLLEQAEGQLYTLLHVDTCGIPPGSLLMKTRAFLARTEGATESESGGQA